MSERVDAAESGPGGRRLAVPSDLASGVLFFLLGVGLLLALPGQVAVAQNEVVNGRVFPRLLILLMMACSLALVVKDLVKLARKQPLETKILTLPVEMRALAIFAILLGTYLLCEWTGFFVLGACFCCVAFLLFFRCRKWHYYAITLGCAVAIWASFHFILNVNF